MTYVLPFSLADGPTLAHLLPDPLPIECRLCLTSDDHGFWQLVFMTWKCPRMNRNAGFIGDYMFLKGSAVVYLNLVDIPSLEQILASSHSHTHLYNTFSTLNYTTTYNLSPRDQPTHSQWRPLSKPSTTSLSPSRALPLVSARRPTRRLPRTATSTLALGKPEQIFRDSLGYGPLTHPQFVRWQGRPW